MPMPSLSADRRKFFDCSAFPFVPYTSAVLLNTVRPNSPRHSQLASNLPIAPLLRRPSVKLGFALPRTFSSSPVGASVSPLVHPVLPAVQAKTCLPCSFTRRKVAPQNVPSG